MSTLTTSVGRLMAGVTVATDRVSLTIGTKTVSVRVVIDPLEERREVLEWAVKEVTPVRVFIGDATVAAMITSDLVADSKVRMVHGGQNYLCTGARLNRGLAELTFEEYLAVS